MKTADRPRESHSLWKGCILGSLRSQKHSDSETGHKPCTTFSWWTNTYSTTYDNLLTLSRWHSIRSDTLQTTAAARNANRWCLSRKEIPLESQSPIGERSSHSTPRRLFVWSSFWWPYLSPKQNSPETNQRTSRQTYLSTCTTFKLNSSTYFSRNTDHSRIPRKNVTVYITVGDRTSENDPPRSTYKPTKSNSRSNTDYQPKDCPTTCPSKRHWYEF